MNTFVNTSKRLLLFLFCGLLLTVRGQESGAVSNAPVTNLCQLVRLINDNEHVVRDVRLDATVCAASDPDVGVAILQDPTDVELVQWGAGRPGLSPGEKIRIEGGNCLLRRRDTGVQISAAPIVDNDKIHGKQTTYGGLILTAGRHPFTLECFGQYHEPYLELLLQVGGTNRIAFPASAFSHGISHGPAGPEMIQPGLEVQCYGGNWERVPNFDLLKPFKSDITSNCDVAVAGRPELVGFRFKGFLEVPTNGYYGFYTRSSDGSLMFIGDTTVPVKTLGLGPVPVAESGVIGQAMSDPNIQTWVSLEGSVDSVHPAGKGLELQLRAERNTMPVWIADAAGLDQAALLNSHVRVTGIGRGTFNLSGGMKLGEMSVAGKNELEILEAGTAGQSSPAILTKAREVQTLPLEDAKRHLPVRLRGVVTAMGASYDYWLSIQDDTRGIFVDYHNASNAVPVCGDYYEITGRSGAGDFAPVVLADHIVRLGKGELPEPSHPAWSTLINGSMDVQWVEFQGLVTDVHSNVLSLYLPDGQLEAEIQGFSLYQLPSFEKAVVRIRGVLFAEWNAIREVRVGRILIRNASVTVDVPAPADPFAAVLKTPREMLLFDARATPFGRVKVRGQVIHNDGSRLFLMEDGAGLRILPAEKSDARVGDLVEVVGYPDIGGMSPQLREAYLRKTGDAALPAARQLPDSELVQEGLDSTLVRAQGKLLGWHFEQDQMVLEMQAREHLFLARFPYQESNPFSVRAGSKLALDGVYLTQGRNQQASAETASFELLLNSPADITVLLQPPWWTLQRLLVIVGILLGVIAFASVWITQLRRVVEQRTAQLQSEIRQRERIERQRVLEAERSRIARDLHDDLGSSLTEIGVLASTGQRAPAEGANGSATLFQSIAAKARGLIAALDVIVWAVDPEDNSLQSLADYLSGYAREYLESSGIAGRFKVPVTFPPVTLEGRVRHELLMTVKETLNNIVRHAGATEVEFRMALVDDVLEIVIADNGKGFAGRTDREGHGLKNLSARLGKIGGNCRVDSQIGGGTTVKISLPLPVHDPAAAGPAANGYTTFD